MREPVHVIRGCREVDEPREQRAMCRGGFCGGPCPRCPGVRWLVLCIRDGDRGGLLARGITQPDDVQERAADRLEVQVDGRCGRSARRARELAT